MNINIKYTNLDSTLAIEEYIKEKIGSLEKFVHGMDQKGVAEAFVEIARTTKHHQKGDVFRAECDLKLSGKILRASHEDWDVRLCVDEVRQEIEQQLKKYLERVRPQDSGGQKKLRELRGK